MAERVTKSDTIHVAVPSPNRVTKSDTIHVGVAGQRVTKTGTIHVNVGTLTVVAGPNLVVEPGQAFTLTAVENLNGTTVASRAWKIGGTTVGTAKSLSQVAPGGIAGQTITYTYTATTTGSATATGSLVVTVLPAMRRGVLAGVVRPLIRRMNVS
jgi:hypothetical protein